MFYTYNPRFKDHDLAKLIKNNIFYWISLYEIAGQLVNFVKVWECDYVAGDKIPLSVNTLSFLVFTRQNRTVTSLNNVGLLVNACWQVQRFLWIIMHGLGNSSAFFFGWESLVGPWHVFRALQFSQLSAVITLVIHCICHSFTSKWMHTDSEALVFERLLVCS
jgi:hypothetical protein